MRLVTLPVRLVLILIAEHGACHHNLAAQSQLGLTGSKLASTSDNHHVNMIPAWTTLTAPVARRVPYVLTTSSSLLKRSYIRASSKRKSVKPRKTKPQMKVAVVGCAHGEIEAMYAAVREIERAQSTKVELILCAGDFQAVRNFSDLACLACPDKFRDMRSFWKYYAGSSVATIPTVFVGGNHEASNHLQEIPLGGLVAPNIYFLGNAGVINYKGLRIAGVSGVYTEHNYEKPRTEKPPYMKNQIKSVYHARKTDVDRLLRIRRPVDVVLSHDWPRGIWHHGDYNAFLTAKPFLRAEIERNTFGNPGTATVLGQLQPRFWFSAHIHVKFPALVRHSDTGNETRFLALDKVLPRRDFIQLIDIPVNSQAKAKDTQSKAGQGGGFDERTIELDEEWLTILRTEGMQGDRSTPVTEQEMDETMRLLKAESISTTVQLTDDFTKYAEDHNPNGKKTQGRPETLVLQPRSERLMKALDLQLSCTPNQSPSLCDAES